MINERDFKHLERCVELAGIALEKGNAPFGSLLVSENGEVLKEDHNRIGGGDNTQHPEFALARWAANNMTPEERRKATVYTSGEHCSMCASAHGLVGLGRIVYASSTKQLVEWRKEYNASSGPLQNLSIEEVIKDTVVDGPEPELAQAIGKLHQRFYNK